MSFSGQHHSGSFLKSHMVLLVLAAATLILLLLWPQAAVSRKSLGQCLAEKGLVMYGADSCENCANQKKLFGADFRNVKYVNCEFDYELCREKGITLYPVWSLGDKILLGSQTLKELAEFAGCLYTD